MKDLVFAQTQLNEVDSLSVLSAFDLMFSPRLSTKIDISEYSKKLSKFASWILCKDADEIVGYIAFYQNIETGVDYIPSICVLDSYRNYHIASRMMAYMIEKAPLEINEIKLECRQNNISALGFYKKNGFEVVEENEDKYLMKKKIR